jgi:crotonobetainyl-CoA:carnitine CoA-transferase CaiB-like acyl-CoA transferase
MGLSIIDMMAGLSMSFALVSSVMQARETGVGRDVDVNLFDTALFNLNYLAQ